MLSLEILVTHIGRSVTPVFAISLLGTVVGQDAFTSGARDVARK